jgi:ADP-heptose:LPS heptosyltransferase
MPEVARLWRGEPGGRVLLVTGPAEEERAARLPCDALARNERLDHLAALLRRAHLYLGNDSGVSHLAGLAGARGLVLFGPTDPRTWRPRGGGLRVLHAPTPCPACGPERFCVHRATVDTVGAALADAACRPGSSPRASVN